MRPSTIRHIARISFLSAALGVLAIPGSARDEPTSPSAAESPVGGLPVDFASEIWPILEARCHRCHSSQLVRGGLRLDSRAGAERGGYSGDPLLSPDLEKNGLYLRLTTEEIDLRMPLGEDALSDHEIDLVRRWIEGGAEWPEEGVGSEAPGAIPGLENEKTPGSRIREFITVFLREAKFGVIAVLVLALASLRARNTLRRSPREFRWRPARWTVLGLSRISPTHLIVLGLILAIYVQDEVEEQLENRLARLERSHALEHRHVFGRPAKPFRPPQPKSLESVYYRGNCERRETLFNQGNYRTATLRLGLTDREGTPVRTGDPVPSGGLYAEFWIERAPNTAAGMYSPKTMESVFLTETYYAEFIDEVEEPYTLLDVVEPNRLWRTRYPIDPGSVRENGKVTGLIYVFLNLRRDSLAFRPTVHYGIQYDLLLEDGRVSQESDLWLGNLFWTPRLKVPRPDALPIVEWFSTEPIPFIEKKRESEPNERDLPALPPEKPRSDWPRPQPDAPDGP